MKILIEILHNKWFLSLLVGWSVFLLLIDWKKVYINIWGGVSACILQLIHDTEQVILNNYHIHNGGIWILKSPAFFTLGVVFPMGVIFLQFMPQNKILKIFHVIAFSLGFLAFEFIVTGNEMLEYVHSNYLLSLTDNILVLASIAWIKELIISVYNSIGRKSKKC